MNRWIKRALSVAILLNLAGRLALAVIIWEPAAPKDDPEVRRALRDEPELKALWAKSSESVETRLWPLDLAAVRRILGPKLDRAPE